MKEQHDFKDQNQIENKALNLMAQTDTDEKTISPDMSLDNFRGMTRYILAIIQFINFLMRVKI